MIQLGYAYHQILSVLTLHQLVEIFKKKPNYDLRLLLEGDTEGVVSLEGGRGVVTWTD